MSMHDLHGILVWMAYKIERAKKKSPYLYINVS